MQDVSATPHGSEPYEAGAAYERQFDEQATARATGPQEELAFWNAELKAARRIEERWRKEAAEAEKLFFGDGERGFDEAGTIESGAAIANSNLNTVRPAIFSQMPPINVKRRFRGDGLKDSTLHRKVATAAERIADYLVERNGAEQVFERARDQWITAGRAVTRVVYEAEFEDAQEIVVDPLTGQPQAMTYERKVSEDARLMQWPWRDTIIGPAASWDRVPWIAFDAHMTRPEYDEMDFDVPSDQVAFDIPPDGDGGETKDAGLEAPIGDADAPPGTSSTRNRVRVTEIWDRRFHQVAWVCSGYAESMIGRDDDPLGLERFWPVPEPLLAETIGDSMLPRPDVAFYRKQIEEIDLASARLNRVLRAMKLRGMYPGKAQGEIERMFEGSEAIKMIGVSDFQGMIGENGNLDRMVTWMPIDMLVAMANALVAMREQAKAQMYESTGISDIVRGHGNPNETATAQGLKGKFAGLRFARRQHRFARHVRDSVRLLLEVAVEHFDTATLANICQMDLPMTSDPVPDPETGEMVPPDASWEQVHAILRDDFHRSYIIQIETDDTLLADEEADREARVAFLTAFVQAVTGLAPMMQSGLMPLSMFKQMLLFAIRGFRKARALEDMVQDLPDQMPPPADEGPSDNEVKIQIEQIRREAEAMLQVEKLGHDSAEAEKDRAHDLKIKGVDLMVEAEKMKAEPVEPPKMESSHADQR